MDAKLDREVQIVWRIQTMMKKTIDVGGYTVYLTRSNNDATVEWERSKREAHMSAIRNQLSDLPPYVVSSIYYTLAGMVD